MAAAVGYAIDKPSINSRQFSIFLWSFGAIYKEFWISDAYPIATNPPGRNLRRNTMPLSDPKWGGGMIGCFSL